MTAARCSRSSPLSMLRRAHCNAISFAAKAATATERSDAIAPRSRVIQVSLQRKSAMTGWNGEIRDGRGHTKSIFENLSFADVIKKVSGKKSGKSITFVPPIDAPRDEIDELVRMGGGRPCLSKVSIRARLRSTRVPLKFRMNYSVQFRKIHHRGGRIDGLLL